MGNKYAKPTTSIYYCYPDSAPAEIKFRTGHMSTEDVLTVDVQRRKHKQVLKIILISQVKLQEIYDAPKKSMELDGVIVHRYLGKCKLCAKCELR